MPKGKRKHYIKWTPDIWSKLAKQYASTFVRLSQSGKEPSFRSVFHNAQAFLPEKLQRNGNTYTSFSYCPDAFKKEVNAEIERLTSVKGNRQPSQVNGSKHEAVNDTSKQNGAIELISKGGEDMYMLPPFPIFTGAFREALKKAGFKFEVVHTMEDIVLLNEAGKSLHRITESIIR